MHGRHWNCSTGESNSWLLKNAHLRRSPQPSSLQPYRVPQNPIGSHSSGFRAPPRSGISRRSTCKTLDIFEQPREDRFFTIILSVSRSNIWCSPPLKIRREQTSSLLLISFCFDCLGNLLRGFLHAGALSQDNIPEIDIDLGIDFGLKRLVARVLHLDPVGLVRR